MERIALNDGGWFDKATATCYDEDSYHDGSNHISKATGSQWEHESLFRTRKGKWVLHHRSQRQGIGESYREVLEAEAVEWLVRNSHDVPADLTEAAESAEL